MFDQRRSYLATLITSSLLSFGFGSVVYHNRFVASFGRDTKSVEIVTETITERSRMLCADRCMSRTLCVGFNSRRMPNGRRECELIQGPSELNNIQREADSVFYRIVNSE